MTEETLAAGGGPAGPPPGLTVVVYGRPGCHLCEEALVVIERVRKRVPFALEQRDIEADDELFKRYLERIPVVEIDRGEVFELFVDETEFEQALAKVKR
ncbi:MAG TPA: glutaredoxin family protein [Solirubrobacteraceae bacterium]|nr:glutaredoxin family protein [Solirubrobacteraceae bacterium]